MQNFSETLPLPDYNPIVRVDLHMHGPIGFQPYFLKKQGYAGKNLLKLIVDEAIARDIAVTAVTSHYTKFDQPNDRFGTLMSYDAKTICRDYEVDLLGENAMSVRRGSREVILLNGQTVMAQEDNQKYDILVVGSNRVANGMSLTKTLEFCREAGFITVAEHPYVTMHRGIGEKKLLTHMHLFDAIEGFNSQAIFPFGANDKAKSLADAMNKPSIAVSDAHRIEDLGRSHIFWESEEKLPSSEKEILAHIKKRIQEGRFEVQEKAQDPFGFLSWQIKFVKGISLDRKKVESFYTPCENL